MHVSIDDKLGSIDILRTRDSYASLRRAWRHHFYILPSILISLVVCAWFVTWGDGAFFAPESFCRYYDAQAMSILQGRLDVPPDAIGFEAFVFQGKTYGYFGIMPAVLRLPLVLMFGDLNGLSSRAMMMAACALNLLCAYGILCAVRSIADIHTRPQRVVDSLFIVCAGIGSTNIFLMSRSFVFHEATMWAGAFALACAWAAVRYRQTGKLCLLVLASSCALMSFHSRPTSGTGALLMIAALAAILTWRVIVNQMRAQLLHAVSAAVAFAVTLVTYAAVNYAKFRTVETIPLRYYQLYVQNPTRLQVTGGKQIHPENLATGAVNYFGWQGVRFGREFPWLYLNDEATVVGSPAIDVVEPFSSVPISMPALSALALVGVFALCRQANASAGLVRIPALGLWIGGSIVLMTVGITERYLHDFYPALILCAAIGVARIGLWRPRALISGLALLAFVSVSLNCAFALVYQRAAPWGVPLSKRAEFIHWQESFGR